MAQHDFVLDNANGATFRADLNAALEALVTNSSAATAPTTTFANQWWADTSTNILKRRNNANTAWISVMSLTTGLIIGTDVQAYDAALASLVSVSIADGQMLYGIGSDTFGVIATEAFGRALLARTSLDAAAPIIHFQNDGTTLGAGVTLYCGTSRDSLAESTVLFVVGRAGTLKNLYIQLTGSPGAGQTFTFTVMKNGVATAMTVTVSDTNITGSDLSNTVTVAATDYLSLRCVGSAGASNTGDVSAACIIGE